MAKKQNTNLDVFDLRKFKEEIEVAVNAAAEVAAAQLIIDMPRENDTNRTLKKHTHEHMEDTVKSIEFCSLSLTGRGQNVYTTYGPHIIYQDKYHPTQSGYYEKWLKNVTKEVDRNVDIVFKQVPNTVVVTKELFNSPVK